MLGPQLKHAAEYWKTCGPAWVARVAASKFVGLLGPVLPPVVCKSAMMYLRLGYWPNIRNPRTFNEKVAHRQLFAPHPLGSLVADKWRVREYVAERGLRDILNEVYFVTDDPATIPFADLPDQFVIKANHGSGTNIIVKDRSKLKQKRVIRQCRKWLTQKSGKVTHNYETHYDGIAPLILVERYIEAEEGRGALTDYKLFCFRGLAQFIQVDLDRFVNHTRVIYDCEWRDTGMRYIYSRGELVPKPPRFEEMLRVVERLSADFDFCRIDLYAPEPERLLFGEITMNPQGGLGPFTPREWDFRLGELW